jgi:hypothetical protein
MKKVLLSLAVLLVSAGSALAQIQLERTWQTFNSPKGDWSILSPGAMEPDEGAQDAKSKMGSYGYRDSEGFFAVTYRDLPKVPKKLKEYYEKNREGAIKGVRGTLLSDNEFSRGSLTGREIYIQTETRVLRGRMFFHGKRFYLILAVLPGNQIGTAAINKYMDSFTVK